MQVEIWIRTNIGFLLLFKTGVGNQRAVRLICPTTAF